MSHFFAYMSRMKFIERWALMRSTQKENVQEHSLQVAMIAHSLAVIKNKLFGGNVNEDRVVTLAIYHDASEVLTGDLPTPVKYFNIEIKHAYQKIEKYAASQMVKLLPQELRDRYKNIFSPDAADAQLVELVKAADTICAYIKCLEEKSSGNPEFARAQRVIEAKVFSYNLPEVKYFIEKFVPSFSLTLDELSEPLTPVDEDHTLNLNV